LICLSYRDVKTPETAQHVYEEFNRVYRSGKPVQGVSYEIITKDGSKRFVEASVALIKGSDGKPLGFRGTMRNITERKEAEHALQKSERSYRLLFERNLYGVFRSTVEGEIIDCNDAFVQMHGYESKEELKSVGAWNLYFRAEDRMSYLDPVRMNTPILNLEVLHRRKDGSPIWAVSNVTLVKGEDGEAILEGVLLDISERKKVERELKASRRRLRELTRHQQTVREDERTRIAREIHDELGQAMTGMKLDLAWMRSRLPENSPVLKERMDSMTSLIDSTIHTMQRIATELRPRILDDLGLVAAIEWQAQEWQSRTGMKVVFKAEPEDISMSRSRSTSLFRIFQESLTNVTRHAKATEVRASLKKENGSVTLTVEDNGRGITDREIGHYRSLGLIGMRERALACGGTVDITRANKKGTKVIACLPLDAEVSE
jgi:PAS domain S-box-containing protein